jgi:hypothetical protein
MGATRAPLPPVRYDAGLHSNSKNYAKDFRAMSLSFRRLPAAGRFRPTCLAFVLLCGGAAAYAADATGTTAENSYPFTLQTSVATRHFHPSSTQNNHQALLNLEWNYKPDVMIGAASFLNTYEQHTQLVYWGMKFRPLDAAPEAYIKVVAGLIHGYKGKYRDSIPFNQLGIAPAVLPTFGYCYQQLCSELIVFGAAGAMWTAGVRF